MSNMFFFYKEDLIAIYGYSFRDKVSKKRMWLHFCFRVNFMCFVCNKQLPSCLNNTFTMKAKFIFVSGVKVSKGHKAQIK